MKSNISFQPQPAYVAQTCHSRVVSQSTTELDTLTKYVREGYLILWQFDAVIYARISGGELVQPPPHLRTDLTRYMVRARAFNRDREWHLWRANQEIYGRQRIDQPGEGSRFVEADMKLRGVVYTQLGVPEDGPIYRLRTRNYYTHNTYFQAGYVDQRLVEITPQNGGTQ